jgi:RNA polymerase sigma-70 factor (ECF subfamily)
VGWPPDDDLLAAWRRLLADPTAGGAFFTLVVRPLAHALLAWRPPTDPDAAETAATDAILALLKHPERYDPTRLRLPAYMRMIARRRLINLFASEARRQSGRIPWDAVELDTPGRNGEEDDSPALASPDLQAVVASLTEVDRQLLELMLDGERKTAVFAAVLGITDRPVDEREREVKRAKDRIKARLRRAGRGDG